MTLTCFLSYYWVSRHQEANQVAQKRFKQVLCKLRDQFCNNWVNFENKNFRKESYFSSEKNTFTVFLVIPSFADVHKNFITLHKLVQVKRSILKDLISCWKQNILKKKEKKSNNPMKKNTALFFLYCRVWKTSKNIL